MMRALCVIFALYAIVMIVLTSKLASTINEIVAVMP